MHVIIFFFKQKTAYELRISDWSSDVCSSDLAQRVPAVKRAGVVRKTVDRVLCDGASRKPVRVVQRDANLRSCNSINGQHSVRSRSDERREGKEWDSTCRYRWSQAH